MSAGVRIGIEQGIARALAGDDVVGLVFAGLGDTGEEILGLRRFRGQDIFNAPGGVQ